MAISKEQVIRAVAEKVDPSITVEVKLEKGTWRVTLTKEGKTSLLELKRGLLEDYLERGEYQQEMAFATRVNKALKGLMTMPPYFEDPEESRPYFRALRELGEAVSRRGIPGVLMEDLSMGMSSDFEVAAEEGATLVRVGTAIFGSRPAK